MNYGRPNLPNHGQSPNTAGAESAASCQILAWLISDSSKRELLSFLISLHLWHHSLFIIVLPSCRLSFGFELAQLHIDSFSVLRSKCTLKVLPLHQCCSCCLIGHVWKHNRNTWGSRWILWCLHCQYLWYIGVQGDTAHRRFVLWPWDQNSSVLSMCWDDHHYSDVAVSEFQWCYKKLCNYTFRWYHLQEVLKLWSVVSPPSRGGAR